MSEPEHADVNGDASAAEADVQRSGLEQLREIIVAPLDGRVSGLEAWLASRRARTRLVAEHLPDAMRRADHAGDELTHAMAPVLEGALKHAAERRPAQLSEALAPALGPAIRTSIRHAIQAMMQSLNQTLEHAFSARGLKWRLDAWRTGRPYAEIVMLNTLRWRVEQVFLIHRESGLLLAHASRDVESSVDADVISGMLTAIRDFARDSFGAAPGEEFERLRMGETDIWLASGPEMLLALECRGTVPEWMAERMQACVEQVRRRWGEELDAFDGDASAMSGLEDMLHELLEQDSGLAGEGGGSPAKAAGALIVMAALLLAWAGHAWYQRWRWRDLLQRVDAMPGVVVTHASESGPPYTLQGMRDPLADDPMVLLEKAGLTSEDVRMRWTPFQSLRPAFVLRRARRALHPPAGVTLTIEDGVLKLSGRALPEWVGRARLLAGALAGVRDVDASSLEVVDPARELMHRLRGMLQPPQGVRLRLERADRRFVLHVSGRARRDWLRRARRVAGKVDDLAGYDDKGVTVLDDPRRLLRLARKALKPPGGVRLSVSDALRLKAEGVASPAWKRRARKAAAGLPYLTGYDDAGLRPPPPAKPAPPDDAAILAAARAMLHPPAGITLEAHDGVLTARGLAFSGWLARARGIAPGIDGVRRWEDAGVQDANVWWRRWNDTLHRLVVRYDFSNAAPRAGQTEALARVAEIWRRARQVDAEARLTVTGLSQASGERQKLVALGFARDAAHRLTKLGVAPGAMRETWAAQRGSRRVSGVRFALESSR